MRIRRLVIAAALLAATGVAALILRDTLRGYTRAPSEALGTLLATAAAGDTGALQFVYGDFGGINSDALRTNALPWKVAAAALVLADADSEGGDIGPERLIRILRRFGFLVPDTILNWPAAPTPSFSRPLGVVTGHLRRHLPRFRLEVATLGCAACHAGVTYDANGTPKPEAAWLGLPNTSLDLEAYTFAVYRALERVADEPDRLLAAIGTLFPETDTRELRTIRRFVLPAARNRLATLRATVDAPAPFHNGGPGLTNGVASLKFLFRVLPEHGRERERGFTSIPQLADVRGRRRFLSDGVYALRDGTPPPDPLAVPRIVAFFTVPTMGNTPERAEQAAPAVRHVLEFLAATRPPPFPGPIDTTLARSGRAMYETFCATCHGTYAGPLHALRLTTFPDRIVPQDEIGTDPLRWETIDDRLLAAVNRTRYRDHLAARRTGGYRAPTLHGIWTTAPYLHNGSVPTLWHLMHPDARPIRFQVGGHRLTWEYVGIDGTLDDGVWRYPADHVPWSTPALYDTRLPGQGNGGHEDVFRPLDERAKRALIEFLKLL